MKITHITLKNFMGFSELELSPRGYTEITGKNGQGKTSVMEAVKQITKSGHDATLLRKGAEAGEVGYVLDDGMTISRKINESTSTTEVRGADGKKVARPASTIAALTDIMSINPVDFLMAPKKDRVRVLLESMPLEADVEELSRLSGIEVTAQQGLHALSVIEQVHKQVYDERTGTNRAVTEKQATINQLRQAMPDENDPITGDEDELVAKVDAARTARDTKLEKIRAKMDGIKIKAQADIDAIRTKLQADIDALKAEAQGKVDAIKADEADNAARASNATEATNTAFNETTAPLNEALAAIRRDREAAAKRLVTQQTIDTMAGELEVLKQTAIDQTNALKAVEQYKSKLLDNLPISGLEVKDGEIYRDGVVLDRLNTAQQVSIAVEIAKLRAGELGIICIDRAELLDSESLQALRESVAEAGLQLFVTRVSDDEFSVHTED